MSGGSSFPTTRWSLVLAARIPSSPAARDALAGLCEAYWFPLYAFARRRGADRNEALDLTQGFFERLLERRFLSQLRPGEGRFRSFLLSSFKHHVSNEFAQRSASKRGGGVAVISLDAEAAEQRYRHEPRDDRTPELAFEQAWAATLLGRVRQRLEDELAGAGKQRLFDLLSPALTGGRPSRAHGEIARELGISEDAVKMSLLRLRRRFGRLLREEIAEVVAEGQVDDEIRYLLSVVRSG